MPFHLPFNFPYFFNGYNMPKSKNNNMDNSKYFVEPKKNINEKKDSENSYSSESFFEIFGIKLYSDDIIIICLLFLLYTEKVQDEELFICLILLLLS